MAYYLQMDGVDDKVVIPNNPVLQFGVNTFSIEVRLKIKSFPPSADRFILGKRPFTTDGTAGLAQFSLKLNSDKTITFSTFNGAESFVKSTVLAVDTEYLISVCRRADGNINLYVDGISVANNTQAIRNVTNISDMWLGANNRDNNGFANIDLKEVRFWNIETTSTMVQNNKNIRLNGNESGLLLYYGFQEGSGTVITDKTITGLNGTLTGGTWLNDGVGGGTTYTASLSDSVGTSETFTKRFSGFKSLSDAITTGESFSKRFSATVIDSVSTGDGTNEGSAKALSDTVFSADSLAYTQGKAVSLSDSIAISEAISKALTKWQTDGISTGDTESDATSRRLSDAITQTDVITAFGGKSVILTEGIMVSDSVAKAVGRLRSDGLGLAESLGKQLSVRLYDVIISTDAVSTYLPNAPTYRHVMRFPVRLNTRQTVNVTITQRKQFDVDI